MQNFLNMSREEPDKHVYRIMPIHRLMECFQSQTLVLVKPRKWDDPFENWLLKSKVRLPTNEVAGMDNIRHAVFGQCWTLHNETDAMWRIYSPDKFGVKVRTTPKKLLEALKISVGQYADIQCFVGRVQYKTLSDLTTELKHIALFKSDGSGIAESLLYKRREFSHEKEIRLILTQGDPKNDIYSFAIDPVAMFEEIVFDPRMHEALYEAFKASLIQKGFDQNRIRQSALYKPPKELFLSLS